MKKFLLTIPLVALSLAPLAAQNASDFADKPCDSYSAFKDDNGKPGVLLWGKAPLTDFGSRPVTFNSEGIRPLRPAPAPGVHPRILFAPDDLPDVRKRLKETKCGREAWKNILSWTEAMKGNYDDKADYAQPDRFNGSFQTHGRVPLFRLGIPDVGKSHNPKATEIYKALVSGRAESFPEYYWHTMALEAFRCLIETDEKAGKELACGVITAMKLDQARREADPKMKGKIPGEPVGRFQLAFCYDFIFNWLTPEQKQLIHDELALSTWSHDNYGTFNTAEGSRSNWATFSYWLYEVLAIEGEPGFNEYKVRGMYRGWRNLLTYGWFQSGATFEGEAKNQLGMDGVILFSMRAKQYGFENLCGHPYLQAYARTFLPHSANAMLTGFHKYDLLGGSRSASGGFASTDSVGLKFMFPNDKRIDWVFRQAVGDDYSKVPDRPDGYYNGLLLWAVYASDFDPANSDPNALGLGNTFFCGERALMMTRSSWDKEAMQLNLHVRQANGGHPFADRNAIMVAGAGRIWSPNPYASFKTRENSVVCIDGSNQMETLPGQLVGFGDAPLATFAIGDAKYSWDWNWKRLEKRNGYYTAEDSTAGRVDVPKGWEPEVHTTNDFAYLKLPYSYLNLPLFMLPHWIQPSGATMPMVRQPNCPVQKAFRTAALIRGSHPYAVIVDDIQKDASTHRYDWTLALEYDVQIAKVEKTGSNGLDIYLTGTDPDQTGKRPATALASSMDPGANIPKGQPMLLVRLLNRNVDPSAPDAEPTIVELPNGTNPKKYSPVRRLVIPTTSVSPEFKVLLYPYRSGSPIPATAWNPTRTQLTVSFDKQQDEMTFPVNKDGWTEIHAARQTAAGATKILDTTQWSGK